MKRAVFADHLGDVEAQTEALLPVLFGVDAHRRQRNSLGIERENDLVDEGRDVIEELRPSKRARGDQALYALAPARDEAAAPLLQDLEEASRNGSVTHRAGLVQERHLSQGIPEAESA